MSFIENLLSKLFGGFCNELLEKYLKERYRKKTIDKKLFEELHDLLPSERGEAVNFFANYHFEVGFEENRMKPLETFKLDWRDANHEFLDRKLEKKRKDLYAKISIFIDYFNSPYRHLKVWNPADLNPLEKSKIMLGFSDEFKNRTPEEYEKKVEKLKILANDVWLAHQELVRLARQKLLL